MSATIVTTTETISVGDVVAYPGRLSHPPRGRQEFRSLRDYLRVTRVGKYDLAGKREHPQEWERDIEFCVYPTQLTENGVEVIDRPTRSEQSLEGAAVNGLTPVGQEANSD